MNLRKKFFWWGQSDPLMLDSLILWKHDGQNSFIIDASELYELVTIGYREISYRTAHNLGLPTKPTV